MNYNEYRRLPFEKRVEVAKRALLEYFRKILDSYSFDECPEDELRKEMPYSKTAYSGICDTESRTILINSGERGYGQLRTLLHECLEAIIGDRNSINTNTRHNNRTYIFPHSRIDGVVKEIMKDIKSQ